MAEEIASVSGKFVARQSVEFTLACRRRGSA